MRWAWGAVLVVVAAWAATPRAAAQDVVFQQPQVFDPATVGAQFLIAPNEPAVAAEPSRAAGVRGVVGGFGENNHTNAAVGFYFGVPLWSYRDFLLAAPPGFEALFPAFGGSGHVSSKFAFIPRVNLNYYVEDVDLAVGASGTFMALTGRVDRQQFGTDGPTGQLTATSNLTLVSANLVEFGRKYAFLELFPNREECGKPAVVDSTVDLSIGTRFVSLDQNYTGTLLGEVSTAGGQNVTTRFSTQSFRGIGITGASNWELPVGENWGLFNSTRVSLLLGDNRRTSSVSVTGPGQPGFSATQYDDTTSLVPVVELELGVLYGVGLGDTIRDGLPPPRFTIRVAAIGQFWGGMGPLSAGSTQGFRNSDLFVVGGYIQAGYRF